MAVNPVCSVQPAQPVRRGQGRTAGAFLVNAVVTTAEVVAELATPAPEAASRSWRGDFRWLFAAYSVSIIGDQFTMVALPLAAWARTGDARWVGAVGASPLVAMM